MLAIAGNVVIVWFVLALPFGMLAGNWLRAVREAMDRRDEEWYNACVRPGSEGR